MHGSKSVAKGEATTASVNLPLSCIVRNYQVSQNIRMPNVIATSYDAYNTSTVTAVTIGLNNSAASAYDVIFKVLVLGNIS